ncbi:MAG: hypothetical protein PHE55_04810 [Methylococcaceae bacterium]|nr:hypothetical protein [Methylococcaceae bacterium]
MLEEKSTAGEGEQAPMGTWILLILVAIGMTIAWLFLYFDVFLPRGTVS